MSGSLAPRDACIPFCVLISDFRLDVRAGLNWWVVASICETRNIWVLRFLAHRFVVFALFYSEEQEWFFRHSSGECFS